MKQIITPLIATAAIVASCTATAAPVSVSTGNMMLFTAGMNAKGFANLAQPYTVNANTIFSRTFSGLKKNVVGTGKVTLTVLGEFDNTNEHIDLFKFENINFGPVFNGKANDDIWDNASWKDLAFDLSGKNYNFFNTKAISVTAKLNNAEMKSLLADGNVGMTFSFSSDINDYYSKTSYINVALDYDVAVPEPGSAALLALGLGLAGLAGMRKRKQA